jgi:hypothetical protein
MDTESLLQNVRNFFLEQYKDLKKTDSFLAFEPIGCVIDPDSYKNETTGLLDSTKANEDISEIVDRVPEISDVYIPGLDKISSHYEIVINSAQFNSSAIQAEDKSDYIALFGKIKSDAQGTFKDADKMSVVSSGGKFFPATTIPAEWYDKDSAIWATKEFHLKDEVITKQPEAAKPIDRKMQFLWKNIAVDKIDTEKVTEANPVLKNMLMANLMMKVNPVVAAATEAEPITVQPALASFKMSKHFSRIGQINEVQVEDTPAQNETENIKPILLNKSRALLNINPAIMASMSAKADFNRHFVVNDSIDHSTPVSSTNLSISFDYSIVQIHRFWFDTKMFDFSKLWYTLAQPEGFFSDGQRTPDNRGNLRAIPKAFIIVKNLKIKAEWSANDKNAAQNSVGFGCFNLVNSSFNENNELINPSLQIIGWLCEVMPKTPLTSDPFVKF